MNLKNFVGLFVLSCFSVVKSSTKKKNEIKKKPKMTQQIAFKQIRPSVVVGKLTNTNFFKSSVKKCFIMRNKVGNPLMTFNLELYFIFSLSLSLSPWNKIDFVEWKMMLNFLSDFLLKWFFVGFCFNGQNKKVNIFDE